MKIVVAAAVAAISFAGLATAGTVKKPADTAAVEVAPIGPAAPTDGSTIADGRAVASDQAVGEARRAYRAQCDAAENAAFCECVTAGVAQALPPEDVLAAASTLRDRLVAEGDASDRMTQIEQVEGHYADACASLR